MIPIIALDVSLWLEARNFTYLVFVGLTLSVCHDNFPMPSTMPQCVALVTSKWHAKALMGRLLRFQR
uniref:Putative secreted protein n=1 Tax=Anopheles triannulatus TaxID=58253 RepID=A0A2M4B7N7_9DIPT